MHRRIHFIPDLPRSGSMLLSAPWRQNPRFHAGISGPVGGMFTAMLGEVSGRNAFSVFINDAQRQRISVPSFRERHDLARSAAQPARCAHRLMPSRLTRFYLCK